MKKWNCDSCGNEIKVLDSYEPEFCCDGRECGCYGRPINQMFCDDCERIIWGKPIEQTKDDKIDWLKKTGYIANEFDEYTFRIRIDDYGAIFRFKSHEIIETPLEVLKEIHANFIERAERKEFF